MHGDCISLEVFVVILAPVTVYMLGQLALSFSYVVIHSFPSWLVCGRNQVYCSCCSAQMPHYSTAGVCSGPCNPSKWEADI